MKSFCKGSTKQNPMTVQDLRDCLDKIEDGSTPVRLETGEPVHYFIYGMISKEPCFYFGVL